MRVGKSHARTATEVTGEIVQDRLEYVIQVGRPIGHIDVGIETKVHSRRQEASVSREENQDRCPSRASGVPFDTAGREGVMNALTEPAVKPGPIRPTQLGQEIPLIGFPGLSAQTEQVDNPQEPLLRREITQNLPKDVRGKGGQDGGSRFQTPDLQAVKLSGEKAVCSTGTESLTPVAAIA